MRLPPREAFPDSAFLFFCPLTMITSQALASVENLLSQMRAVARASQGMTAQPQTAALEGQGSFAAELARSLDRVSHAQNAANAQARAFELGDPDVSLSNVMIDLQKAGLSFQATVQVRNRLVDAYKEIANMAV
ncbi:flagellar hook-basal body complex protein FliE [Castellaniella caeni]